LLHKVKGIHYSLGEYANPTTVTRIHSASTTIARRAAEQANCRSTCCAVFLTGRCRAAADGFWIFAPVLLLGNSKIL
jgi:hypothetical protein